ncbi:MAG: NrfD/PsrC family molybdoenzyme membrane anchor subunit [Planctomycetota bacterium]
MDPNVNGQLQRDWGWLIAAYLFLGGVGAGAYTIGAINGLAAGGADFSTRVGLWVGFPALLIGTLCLLLDLGSPVKAVLAGVKLKTSWIARGFWIISAFMALSLLHLVLLEYTAVRGAVLAAIAVAGIVFAVGTMAYTGILLGAAKGIPFWRTGAVPVVFVVSALVTGHFTLLLGIVLFGGRGMAAADALELMTAEAVALVVGEVLAISFFLQAAFKQPDSRESAERILRRTSFVVGYAVLGLLVPLVLMLVLRYGLEDAAARGYRGTAALGAVLGLVGGLLLRHAVLVCGTLPTWNIAGFQFRRIARPKEPKPGIGLLPPR